MNERSSARAGPLASKKSSANAPGSAARGVESIAAARLPQRAILAESPCRTGSADLLGSAATTSLFFGMGDYYFLMSVILLGHFACNESKWQLSLLLHGDRTRRNVICRRPHNSFLS
ncbi:hypothetical protein OVY01_04660 [Robbsia sp. Bb-Pol-6]|uniref:Uncharacterized protein n=1 Tax=Robbsia betulipollinis TaxID=2981849 RepID=A0ABT3ZJ31_9BURK|nr:hypothetical protein [Robbsia betulipollinis]MCY0386539.1 hypothetical protein [Robbsia betulipollinis]